MVTHAKFYGRRTTLQSSHHHHHEVFKALGGGGQTIDGHLPHYCMFTHVTPHPGGEDLVRPKPCSPIRGAHEGHVAMIGPRSFHPSLHLHCLGGR